MSQIALIYARFSSAEQAKGYSLERQISQGRKYVEAQGWTLEKVISDEGRSAYSGANRQLGAAFYEFEHEASDGTHSGKVLCVENIDRISRQGAKAAAQLIWRLNELGIDVATWHDGVVYRAESNGDMMELFSVIIKAQMAHEESKKKSQRTNASWKKRHDDIASGKTKALSPRPPAWISIDAGEYVLNKHRAKVLNEIYDLYISGIGIYKIVQILNARNEPSWGSSSGEQNKGWYLAYVHRLLKLRAVMGEYVTNSGAVLATNHYPQVITAEKFNRAQSVRSSKRSTGGGDRVRINNLLSGMVKCAKCGGNAGYENKGQNNTARRIRKDGSVAEYRRKHYERLRCDNNRRKKLCDNNMLFDYKIIEETVLDITASALAQPDREDPRLLQARVVIAEEEREVEGLKRRLSNLIEAIEEAGARALAERVTALENEIDRREGQITTFRRLEALVSSRPGRVADVALIKQLRAAVSDDDYDVRYKSRTETNLALRRLGVDIRLMDDGRFSIALPDVPPMVFDKEGNRGDTRTAPLPDEGEQPSPSWSVPMTEKDALAFFKLIASSSR